MFPICGMYFVKAPKLFDHTRWRQTLEAFASTTFLEKCIPTEIVQIHGNFPRGGTSSRHECRFQRSPIDRGPRANTPSPQMKIAVGMNFPPGNRSVSARGYEEKRKSLHEPHGGRLIPCF